MTIQNRLLWTGRSVCLTLFMGPFGVVCLGETLGELLRKHWGMSAMGWFWFCLYSNPEGELPHRGKACKHMHQKAELGPVHSARKKMFVYQCVNRGLLFLNQLPVFLISALSDFLCTLYFCHLFIQVCVWCRWAGNASPELNCYCQGNIRDKYRTHCRPQKGFPFQPTCQIREKCVWALSSQ